MTTADYQVKRIADSLAELVKLQRDGLELLRRIADDDATEPAK